MRGWLEKKSTASLCLDRLGRETLYETGESDD